jgi:hypothetical protein
MPATKGPDGVDHRLGVGQLVTSSKLRVYGGNLGCIPLKKNVL